MNSAVHQASGIPFSVWSSAFDISSLYHVGKSHIQGEGLFSDKTLTAGTVLGPLTTPFPIKANPWPYSVGPMMKLNHSDKANATAYSQETTSDPGFNIIYVKTTEEIHPNEEITLNYNILHKNLGYGKAEPWYNKG